MKPKGKWWLPDADRHFAKCAKKGGGYQTNLYHAAIKYVGNVDLAVDVGAHVGFMSHHMKKHFRRVVAFEPEPDNFECLLKNVPGIEAHNVALGAVGGMGSLQNPKVTNSGAWEVTYGQGDVRVFPLDDFGLVPDLIKIDVQGRTVAVLDGAGATLRHHPVVLVEAWLDGKRDVEVQAFLESLGAELFEEVGRKDIVMGWR